MDDLEMNALLAYDGLFPEDMDLEENEVKYRKRIGIDRSDN